MDGPMNVQINDANCAGSYRAALERACLSEEQRKLRNGIDSRQSQMLILRPQLCVCARLLPIVCGVSYLMLCVHC